MYSLATLTTFLSESKLGLFWTTFLDIKKQLFVSDKFLNFASEEGKTYFDNVTTVKKSSTGFRQCTYKKWQKLKKDVIH